MNRIAIGGTVACSAVIGSGTSVLVTLAFLWAVIRLLRRDFPLSRVPQARMLALVMALFFVVEAFCGFISYNGMPTLKEIVENFVFLSFLPLYSRLSVSSREDMRDALETAAVIGAFVALLFSLFQMLVLHERAEGGAGNAVPFAVASTVGYTVLWLGCLRADGRRRLLMVAAICASGACILLSGTRALWPGLFIAPIVVFLIYRKHFLSQGFGRTAAILLVLAACIGVLSADFIERRVELAVQDVTTALDANNYSGSFGRRLVIWRVGTELFEEAPIFGQGPGNAGPLLAERSLKLIGHSLVYTHYHDVFLNYAVRDGILGILIVLAMIFAPLILAARHERDEIGTYGFAFLAGMEIAFLLSGAIGIMFGQDIMDALFMISTITGAYLVFGATSAREIRISGEPALGSRSGGG
ncbi:O-antigen ligase family protein [Mesorhizobium koreense]|uniref:O-antigen ligase family protein n=1 Tax=Mesorhizobium koreense TaxID=3074855 RepID=UPI00287B6253|nr:O-antigen ligase family protein [Mesorhizobium sp. WR6]